MSRSALGRRLISVPAYGVAWVLWLATTPVWLPLAAVADLLRRNGGVALRSAALLGAYLTWEVWGVTASAGMWLWRALVGMDEERWVDLHFRLESTWAATLLQQILAIFSMDLEIEDDADLGRGPYLLLFRHASSGDTLLASAIATRAHGLRFRYVLKRALLWDPSIDIVGNRIPNVFVDRDSDDSASEVRRVRDLAQGLGPRDGMLVYPEGTRFSEAKKRRVLERFRERDDVKMIDYAHSLRCVLPPRPGGTLAVLEAAPDADVIVCAHTGFEGAASLAQIWNGELLHRVVRVELRRIPRHEIPTGREARLQWLLDEWRAVDAWVERRQADRERR